MGTKWMIEHRDTQQWWTGSEFTSDPHMALQFSTSYEAHQYCERAPSTGRAVEVTEHIFMLPVSTIENQN